MLGKGKVLFYAWKRKSYLIRFNFWQYLPLYFNGRKYWFKLLFKTSIYFKKLAYFCHCSSGLGVQSENDIWAPKIILNS